MENPILIETNEDEALKKLKEMQENAQIINEKLSYLNEVEGLKPLKNKDEAIRFLQNPSEVLSEKIIESFGDSLTGKRKVNARVLAELYYIPFDEIVSKFREVNWPIVSECDFEKGKFTIKQETKNAIYERAKDYTNTEEEAKAYQLQKQMADAMTDYMRVFNLLHFPMTDFLRKMVEYLDLKISNKDGDLGLYPDFKRIRRKLRNESLNEKLKQL